MAVASTDELRRLASRAERRNTCVGLARPAWTSERSPQLPDDEVVRRLCDLPGIGRWTAEWFLARHLGRPDVWPAGDLGLRKAVSAFYLGGQDVEKAEVRASGERFSPYRNSRPSTFSPG